MGPHHHSSHQRYISTTTDPECALDPSRPPQRRRRGPKRADEGKGRAGRGRGGREGRFRPTQTFSTYPNFFDIPKSDQLAVGHFSTYPNSPVGGGPFFDIPKSGQLAVGRFSTYPNLTSWYAPGHRPRTRAPVARFTGCPRSPPVFGSCAEASAPSGPSWWASWVGGHVKSGEF